MTQEGDFGSPAPNRSRPVAAPLSAEESLRERVAVALWRSDTEDEFPDADLQALWPKVVRYFPADADAYRRNAAAAIAVMRGES